MDFEIFMEERTATLGPLEVSGSTCPMCTGHLKCTYLRARGLDRILFRNLFHHPTWQQTYVC